MENISLSTTSKPEKIFRGTSLSRKTAKVISFINTVLFLGMLFLMFAQVLSRYVFLNPISWSEELIRYTFIVSTYLGSAVAVQRGMHVEINIWPPILAKIKKEKNKTRVEFMLTLFSHVICILFLLLFCWLLFELVVKTNISGQSSPVLSIPMSMISGGILLSSILMTFYFLMNLLEKVWSVWGGK